MFRWLVYLGDLSVKNDKVNQLTETVSLSKSRRGSLAATKTVVPTPTPISTKLSFPQRQHKSTVAAASSCLSTERSLVQMVSTLHMGARPSFQIAQ